MAVNGEITLQWGDGEHKFNVARLRCYLELEEKCGAGIAEIYQRIVAGRWKFNDLRETLRLGLIGAGTTPDRALLLINRYCDDRPLMESVLPAQAVIMAAIVGVEGDNAEKKTQEQTPAERSSEKVDSSAPSSTDSEQPLDSRRVN